MQLVESSESGIVFDCQHFQTDKTAEQTYDDSFAIIKRRWPTKSSGNSDAIC
jgi:hypothetical protein